MGKVGEEQSEEKEVITEKDYDKGKEENEQGKVDKYVVETDITAGDETNVIQDEAKGKWSVPLERNG